MIYWQDLLNYEQLPKDGTRVLVAHFGDTFAQKDENMQSYRIFGLFEIDIIQYIWDKKKSDNKEFYIWSQNHIELSFDQILKKYNKFCIINQPERSKREDIYCCCKKCNCPNISNHMDNCAAHK